MKKLKLLLYILSILFVLPACENCVKEPGKTVIEKFDFEKFTGLDIEFSGTVYVHQSDEHYASLSAPENMRQYIKIEKSGNTLNVESEDCIKTNSGVELHIYMKDIEEVVVTGSGIVKSVAEIKSDKLKLNIAGSGQVELDLNCKKIYTDVSGSGELLLRGKVEYQDIEVSGSGDLSGFALISQETDVKVKGSGNCSIFVTEKLDANVSGSGDLEYKGSPSKVQTNSSGSGTIIMK